jgi:hypothetical protein
VGDGNTGNGKILDGPQSLDAKVAIRRDFAVAKQIMFDTGVHSSCPFRRGF